MLRLAALLYPIVATTLAGVAVIVALVTGHDNGTGIVTAAAIGAVAGLGASWVVARAIVAR